jgi:hypothetical protein
VALMRGMFLSTSTSSSVFLRERGEEGTPEPRHNTESARLSLGTGSQGAGFAGEEEDDSS